MTDQVNFQQQPMRTNWKQLKKIGQHSLKCHKHSPIFMTNFSRPKHCPNIVLSLPSSMKH